jgi:hypothetical protein
MFSSLFHFKILESGHLRFAIRSDQHRVDEYILVKGDIEPALDDDPTDNLWSGTEQFALKRTRHQGFIRIKMTDHSVVHKVSRQDIEILNAQLKNIIQDLPDLSSDKFTTSTKTTVLNDSATFDEMMIEELVGRFRNMLREELQEVQFNAPSMEQIQKPSSSSIPNVTFIPSNLGENVAGEIKTQGQESDALSALEAAKKLKEMKK